MKKINLGKSNLEVSALGLGCIDFGTETKENDAFALMETYVEHGGSFFDTSNNYALWKGGERGASEKVIGNWLKTSNRRKDIILATKMGALPKNDSTTEMQGLGRKTIFEEVEKSLDNLKTDYLDLYYLHVDDYTTPQEETLSALNELVIKGLVKEIGCSNFRTWRVESARKICEQNNYKFFCAIQQRYSYLAPALDADFYPQVTADKGLEEYINFYKDITMVAHTGLLYGLYNKSEIDQAAYDTLTNREKLKKLQSEEKEPIHWVLNYITKQFGGSVVLSTTSSTKHLIDNMNAID